MKYNISSLLPFWLWQLPVFTQLSIDILHIHNSIIHQRAYRNSDTAKRHCIDRQIKYMQNDKCYYDRYWQCKHGYDRCPIIHKEQKQNHNNKQRSFCQCTLYIVNCIVYEITLTEDVGRNSYIWWHCLLHCVKSIFNILHQHRCICLILLCNSDKYRGFALFCGKSEFRISAADCDFGNIRQFHNILVNSVVNCGK